MSQNQVIQSHRELRRVLQLLFDLCERTRVVHGHGDSGNVLSYHDDLKREVQSVLSIAERLNPRERPEAE